MKGNDVFKFLITAGIINGVVKLEDEPHTHPHEHNSTKTTTRPIASNVGSTSITFQHWTGGGPKPS